MRSSEIIEAALATSSTYNIRDAVGKTEYEARVEKLLDAVEPLIAEETRRNVVGQIVDAWAEGEEQCPPLAETIQAIVNKLMAPVKEGGVHVLPDVPVPASAVDTGNMPAPAPIVSDMKIREIAFQAAGAASRILQPDQSAVPNQQVIEAINTVLTTHGVATGPDSAADLEAGRPMRSQWTVNGKPTEHDGDRFYPLAPSGSYDSIGWPEVGDALVVVRHYGASDFSSED